MAQLFADENVPRTVVETLRSRGHDVLTAFETGRANRRIADADQLSFASSQNRAMLTGNGRDFQRLHSKNPIHSGIIAFTDDRDETALAERIHAAISSVPDLNGQLVRVTRPTSAHD